MTDSNHARWLWVEMYSTYSWHNFTLVGWIIICTFAWTDSFVCSRWAVSVSVTHSVCRDTLVPRALKLPRCTHTPKTSQIIYIMISCGVIHKAKSTICMSLTDKFLKKLLRVCNTGGIQIMSTCLVTWRKWQFEIPKNWAELKTHPLSSLRSPQSSCPSQRWR